MAQRPEQLDAVTGIQAGEAGSLDNNNGGRNGKTSRKNLTYMKRQHTVKGFNEMEKYLKAEWQLLVRVYKQNSA